MRYFVSLTCIFLLIAGTVHADNYPHFRGNKALYRYPSADREVEEWTWWATHLDMGHFADFPRRGAQIVKAVNPEFQVLWGNNAVHVNISNNDRLNLINSWCSMNGYEAESCYLHYAEDTRIEANNLQIDIPAGGRMQSYIWDGWQYLLYHGYEGLVQFNIYYYDSVTSMPYQPHTDYPPIIYDGVYFDVHSPIILALDPIYGGTIAEYGAGYIEAREVYMADRIAAMGAMNDSLEDKFLYVNVAEYWHLPEAEQEALATDGAFLEFEPNILKASHPAHWAFTKRLADAGKVMSYAAPSKNGTPDISGGLYADAEERVSMFYLANYYMAKQDTRVFWSRCGGWDMPYDYLWEDAYGYDIGQPLGQYYVVQQGIDPVGQEYEIYARFFENGLVLIRPKFRWDQYELGNASAVEVQLDRSYFILYRDGYYNPTESILLRNGEGVTLFSDGQDVQEDDVFTNSEHRGKVNTYYDILGRQIHSKPNVGIYFERTSNGTKKKIVLR